MCFADVNASARQSNVYQLGRLLLRLQQSFLSLLKCACNLIFYFVCKLTRLRFLFARELTYLAKHLGNPTFAAQVFYAELFQSTQVGDFLQVSKGIFAGFFKFLKHLSSLVAYRSGHESRSLQLWQPRR